MSRRSRWAEAEATKLNAPLNIRVPAEVVGRLDEWAEELGASRSDVVRCLLYGATVDAWPPDTAGTAVVREMAEALSTAAARGAAS